MKDIHALVAEVESKWQTSTNEQKEDLVKKLRKAEGGLAEDDQLTRTHVAELIHRIQASERHHDHEFVVPPFSQGTGFGTGTTLPPRFDVPD